MSVKTVLISGAGIAGPTLAFWLKVAGFEATLVERAPALRTGGYVIDFWGLGYDIAEQMGLRGKIDEAGYHVREVRFVDDDGRRASGFDVEVFDQLTHGRFVTVWRSDLARLLLESVGDATETLFDDEILALEEHPTHVAVVLKRGGRRRFDLVIGADGLHSQVRRFAFGEQSQFEKPLGYIVAAFEACAYRPRDEDAYLMHNQPGRMAARFTLRGNRTLFLFIFADDGPLPETLDQQKAMLHSRYGGGKWECRGILEAMDDAGQLYFDRVSQIRMDRWSRGRVALVGDAAACVSLAAGQGSALAMVSAYVLAGELARSDGRHDAAFVNYEARLRSYIEMKQRGAVRFAAAFAPRTSLGLWYRNQVAKALAIPGLAKLIVGREIVDTLQLPRYAWPRPGGSSE